MSRFGADPLSFFDSIYQAVPPWDIGQPQPAMAALLAEHPPAGPVLDLGCGSGDLTLHLAQLGYQAVGIDFVEAAIAAAQAKLAALPPEAARRASFRVADALRPSLLSQPFGAVVDSGFFHLFDAAQCDRLVDELARVLPPGGRYYLHAFAIEFAVPNVPRGITAQELQARFSVEHGWRLRAVHPAEFLSRVAPPVPAICACLERVAAR